MFPCGTRKPQLATTTWHEQRPHNQPPPPMQPGFFFRGRPSPKCRAKCLKFSRPIPSTHACDSIQFGERSTSCSQMFVVVVPSPPPQKKKTRSTQKICLATFHIFNALGVKRGRVVGIWMTPCSIRVASCVFMMSGSAHDFHTARRRYINGKYVFHRILRNLHAISCPHESFFFRKIFRNA